MRVEGQPEARGPCFVALGPLKVSWVQGNRCCLTKACFPAWSSPGGRGEGPWKVCLCPRGGPPALWSCLAPRGLVARQPCLLSCFLLAAWPEAPASGTCNPC